MSTRSSDGDTSDLPYRRVVAKIGTNLLTGGTDEIDRGVASSLVGQVAALHAAGTEVLVVSSGAIAAGRHRLGMPRPRRDIPARQVFAAVGQSRLMQLYDELFQERGIIAAQTLLTRRDLADRQGYLNARNTLLGLLEFGVVPVINENDVVAVDEIRDAKIGDNDTLSALVANLVEADLLVLLTDIDGLFSGDPRRAPDARRIERVERIDADIERIAGAAGSERGVGGMLTKVRAAALATASGADVVILDGRAPDALVAAARGEPRGTLFPSSTDRREGRRRFLLSGLSARGSIIIDGGAAEALRSSGRSLLAAGVRGAIGGFGRGDAIDIVTEAGERVGRGITNYAADDVERISGLPSGRIEQVLGYEYGSEVVHRNNLVILDG